MIVFTALKKKSCLLIAYIASGVANMWLTLDEMPISLTRPQIPVQWSF